MIEEDSLRLPHVVVFPFPAQGHINPALQFAHLVASSLSLCRVTFINTSHNIAKLRASGLPLGPRLRLQALADNGQHGHGPHFFECVEGMGFLLESLLLKLLQIDERTAGAEDRAQGACRGGHRSFSGRSDHGDLEMSSAAGPGYGDCCSDQGFQQKEDDGEAPWPPPVCIISDVFLGWVQDIADKLGLPRFILFTPSPATLVLMLSLPDMLLQARLPCEDRLHEVCKQPLDLPGLTPTLHLSDVPSHLLLPPSAFMFNYFIRHSKRIPDSAAVLLNTFQELQGSAIDAAAGLLLDACPSRWDDLLNQHQRRRVIPVGPLLPSFVFDESRALRNAALRATGAEDDTCLQWLQRQEPCSVVYVSFGSMGELSKEQIHELMFGLEASGKPFVLVSREMSTDLLPSSLNAGLGHQANNDGEVAGIMVMNNDDKAGSVQREPDQLRHKLESSSMQGKPVQGLLIPWAPQLDVLCHPSVAVFLSHCGWNSSLEAISAGVPLLGWPLFAEQKMNCRFLVDELKVAMEFSKGEGDLVSRKEVERVVREALESEQGKLMRKQALKWKGLARNAISDGGHSQESAKAFGALLGALGSSTDK